MLEIYNEHVQDLLINPDHRPPGGLKVRESKAVGVFVDKLSKHPVSSYEDIANKMEDGNKNRTIGETLMNQTSSRAHTIITVEFKQIDLSGNAKSEKFSMINLVDLAGSEKAGQTGATGDRLKEGCAINKSLTVLGQVISTLADKACGKAKKEVVPYRDSVLTRILQNALGGNSKTIMICALSPSSTNYEETLSTLRYAERAKKIENKAVVNESPQERMIRELKEENEKLRKMLMGMSGTGVRDDPEARRKMEDLQEELNANMSAMQEMQKTWQEKVEEAKRKAEAEGPIARFDKTKPYICNLHEDLQLNGKIVHNIAENQIHVGRKDGNPKPEIVLGGIGIKNNHAVFRRAENGDVYLAPFDTAAAENIFVNGNEIKEAVKLCHNDRVIFGSNVVFLFQYPGREAESKTPPEQEIDWEMAQKEKMNITEKVQKELQEMLQRKRNEESEKKIKEVEAKYMNEKKKTEGEMSKLKSEYEKKLKEFQEKEVTSTAKVVQLEDTKKELEDLKSKLTDMQQAIEQNELEMKLEIENEARLEERRKRNLAEKQQTLLSLGHKVDEAQTLAKDLGRNIRFEPRIITRYPESLHMHPMQVLKECTFDLVIHVVNGEDGTSYMWTEDKFTDRLYMMKDMYNTFVQFGELTLPEKEFDPFWDENEPIFIGMGFYMLKGLAYMIDNPVDICLIGNLYEHTGGKLYMNVVPTDAEGNREIAQEQMPESPQDLINTQMDLLVEIKEIKDLPETCCRDVFCEYKFYLDDNKYETGAVRGRSKNAVFNYTKQHTVAVVTENFLNYLLNDYVSLEATVVVREGVRIHRHGGHRKAHGAEEGGE